MPLEISTGALAIISQARFQEKTILGKQFAETVVCQVKMPRELSTQIETAARFLQMDKSTLVRSAVREFLSLYYPDCTDPTVSVLEPHEV